MFFPYSGRINAFPYSEKKAGRFDGDRRWKRRVRESQILNY
jgi:hypothetical protein